MNRDGILRQIAEARQTMQELARLYPGCFTLDGKPIVASASFPRAQSTPQPPAPPADHP